MAALRCHHATVCFGSGEGEKDVAMEVCGKCGNEEVREGEVWGGPQAVEGANEPAPELRGCAMRVVSHSRCTCTYI